ncbi:alpha/beta fold hydrolase [Pseudolabrys sp.]|uniref:alpha/beta fold hydrolase n=1 Tax=Pseudolabrys sp. TaxID=1960880 RepID=UPI003D146716
MVGETQPHVMAYPAAVNGVLTRVLEAGAGAPVLFLHGVGSRADRWQRNFDIIREGYRCFAIDLPGHGFAQKGSSFPYGAQGYADFVEGFLDDQKLGKVALVGSSLGGHVAGLIACRSPQRIRSLVLVGATGMFPLSAELASGIADRIKDLTRDGIQLKLKNLVFDDSILTDAWLAEEYAINNSPGAQAAFEKLSGYFRDRINGDVIGERLANATQKIPTTLIWGKQDRSVPLDVGLRTQLLLGGVPMHVIEATAHAPYFERPDVFRQHLSKALKD